MVSHPRRLVSSAVPLWEPQIWQRLLHFRRSSLTVEVRGKLHCVACFIILNVPSHLKKTGSWSNTVSLKLCYRCAECQQVFTDTSMWKDHLQQHLQTADLAPFHCPHCNKQFSSKYGLANHVNLHLPETERPHKCHYCNKGFGAKHAMTKHERTHLPDEERLSYVCDICGKRYVILQE